MVNDFQGLGFGAWNNLIHITAVILNIKPHKKSSECSEIYLFSLVYHFILLTSIFTNFNSLNFIWFLFDNPTNKPTRHNVAGNYKAIIIFTWHGIIFMDSRSFFADGQIYQQPSKHVQDKWLEGNSLIGYWQMLNPQNCE